jgi:2',3'-cyclic-nucleotide 2'-phosphodiesterase/3'-nucleotidase
MKKLWFRARCAVVLFLAVSVFSFGQTLDLTILATTDIHTHYLPYDYFTDNPVATNGLVKVAAAIKEERNQHPNILLLDNGDNIQGTPLGDYLVKNPPQGREISPIMRLLNAMRYDAMTLGNHEFNFGLDYLNLVIRGANFPVVSANVVNNLTKTPYFTPYKILIRSFRDDKGGMQTLKIGVLGLVPPQILSWDGAHLRGKVDVLDGYETAKKYVPEMKAKGADIIVILSHSGLSDTPRVGGEENFSYYLTDIPDVDAIITGHIHMRFPSASFAKMAGVNLVDGTIKGVPVVMSGSFGDTLGVIDLRLEKKDGKWQRGAGMSRLVPMYDSAARKSLFDPVPELTDLLTKEHEGALAYIRSPVGGEGENGARLTSPLTSFFALVRDDYSVQLINEAQTWYASEVLKDGEYKNLPIISAAAPFKAGGRQGPGYYTNVPAGSLAIKNMADLYVYSNTIVFVKLTGAEIKEWLEMSAGQFNHIDPSVKTEQVLINDSFPTYNYDIIDGLTYTIDVSKPPKYNTNGSLRDAGSQRIQDLRFKGSPLRLDQEFVVVTNNYRAYGGGSFPGINASKIIYGSPDENRQVILRYIEAVKRIEPKTDNNWKLSLPSGTTVVFNSSPLGAESQIPGIRYLRTAENGYGVYQLEP